MTQALKDKLLELYEQVKDMRSLEEIEAATIPVREWIDNQNWTLPTRGKSLSQAGLNKIFNQLALEDGKNAIQIAKHDANGNIKGYQLRHYVIELLQLTPEQWSEVNSGEKLIARLEHEGTAINPENYLEAMGELLTQPDPGLVAIGLAGVTGRRPTEIIYRGVFEVSGEYSLLFKEGLLKQKGNEVPPFQFPTLYPAKFIIDRLKYLRKDKAIKAAIKQIETECSDDEIAQNKIISDRIGRGIRAKVAGLLQKKQIEIRLGDEDINQKGLRAAYACLAVARDFPGSQGHKMLKYGQILGHLIEGEDISKRDLMNLTTSLGYSDYYIPDGLSVPFPKIPVFDMKTVNVRVYCETREIINELKTEDETQQDAFKRLIETAQHAEKLEQALIESKAEIERLKSELSQQNTPTKQEDKMDKTAIKSLIKECLAEMNISSESIKITLEQTPEQTEKTEQDNQAEIEAIPNDKLWAGRKHPEEKIRRSFLALMEWNDTFSPSNEQRLAITTQSLRALSGCNGLMVSAWMNEHSDEILGHHSKYAMLNPKDPQSLTTYFNKGKDQDGILKAINEKLLGGVAKI
ncbi:MAG: protelomerase family protein [Limnoraphis robusta]